jgi:hypothetical protein
VRPKHSDQVSFVVICWTAVAIMACRSAAAQDVSPLVTRFSTNSRVSFTKDDKYLVTWLSQAVSFWDLSQPFTPSTRPARTVSVGQPPNDASDDGSVLFAYAQYSTGATAVIAFDAPSGRQLGQFMNSGKMILSPPGNLAVVQHTNHATAVSFPQNDSIAAFNAHRVWDVSRDNRYVLVNTYAQFGRGDFNLIDVATGRLLQTFPDFTNDELRALRFSHDRSMILSGTGGGGMQTGTLYLWGVATPRPNVVRTFGPPTINGLLGPLLAAVLSNDDHWIVSGYYYGDIIVWDAFTGSLVCTLAKYPGASGAGISSIQLSPRTRFAAITFGGGAVLLNVRPCLIRYLHSEDIAMEEARSGLFAPKGEFETSTQYTERMAKARTFRTGLTDRYDRQFEQEATADSVRRDEAIRKSATTVVLKIDSIGTYNADQQYFPVVVAGMMELVQVPLVDAPAFKSMFASAKVTGVKRLMRDLKTLETVDVRITAAGSGKTFRFGSAAPALQERSGSALGEPKPSSEPTRVLPTSKAEMVSSPPTSAASTEEAAASGVYVSRTGDVVELRPDGSFVVNFRGQTMRGSFTIQGQEISLKLPNDPRPAKARLTSGGLIWPSGETYIKR